MTTVQTPEGRYVYVPEGFDAPAETVLDSLKQGRALLAEEGRWIKFNQFQNPHPEEDLSTPYCDGWGACAIGGVYCVTVGIGPSSCRERGCTAHNMWEFSNFGSAEQRARYVSAVEHLNDATRQKTSLRFSGVVEFNDHKESTHEAVLDIFDVAIAKVEAVSNSN